MDLGIGENVTDYFRINTTGMINILEQFRENGFKRVISDYFYANVWFD